MIGAEFFSAIRARSLLLHNGGLVFLANGRSKKHSNVPLFSRVESQVSRKFWLLIKPWPPRLNKPAKTGPAANTPYRNVSQDQICILGVIGISCCTNYKTGLYNEERQPGRHEINDSPGTDPPGIKAHPQHIHFITPLDSQNCGLWFRNTTLALCTNRRRCE
eukprot:Gb_16033 [translate_table: standard]